MSVDESQSAQPGGVSISICRDAAAFAALQPEWDDRVERAPAHSGTPVFAFNLQAVRQLGRDAGQLRLIVARDGGRLAGLWPLALRREYGVTIARQLGSGSLQEYASPLISPDAPPALAAAMLQAAEGLADVLEVWNLPVASPLVRLLDAQRRAKVPRTGDCPTISLREAGSWEAWIARRSRSFRQGLGNSRRRLEKLGAVAFREIEAADAADFAQWMVRTKRRWLDERAIRRSWLRDEACATFYSNLIGIPGSGVTGFALTLDGRIICGGICLLAASRLEYFVTAFDTTYAAFSPGGLWLEECVRWCIPRRLDFDFRMMQFAYKLRWADRMDRYEGYSIACTPAGLLEIGRMKLLPLLSAARARVRPVRQWLRRQKRRRLSAAAA
ncbi:MAG: GNAT family N-acetyltransferase [Caulobacterales bacterium]